MGEGLSKKEKGLMDMDNSVVTVAGGVKGSIGELNGNGKNTVKIINSLGWCSSVD